jgi:hypothetical protein
MRDAAIGAKRPVDARSALMAWATSIAGSELPRATPKGTTAIEIRSAGPAV